MLDFILLYIIRYKGRSNNSHKISPRNFRMTPQLFANKGGGSSWRVVQGLRRGMGALVCQALLMNSFFNLWIVATLTLVSFDVTRIE